MFGNRKFVGLFALAAFAATGLAAAPAMAGNSHRGDRCDDRLVYRGSSECAPRGRVTVSLGIAGGRDYREHRGHDRGYSKRHRNVRWSYNRGRNDCR